MSLALGLTAGTAMAGGLLTNTNQNAAYVRQMSQNGIIDLAGLYANPAGTAFLSDGWHFSLNSQSAWQTRGIKTEFGNEKYPFFAANVNNPNMLHDYTGKAKAPIIPSFSLSYNKGKWSVNAHFALGGGGGKCEFNNGLGSLESLYAAQIMTNPSLPVLLGGVNAINGTDLVLGGYGLDAYMSGTNYHFGLTLGGTYKVHPKVAMSLGLRFLYAMGNYQGYVRDLQGIAVSPTQGMTPIAGAATNRIENELSNKGIALDADQKGFNVTPIIGIDYKINDKWNVAAKYEFKTALKLKNDSRIDVKDAEVAAAGASILGKFEDGKKIDEQVPGILTLGAQYTPIEKVRLMAGWNYYFDKNAKKYGRDQKHLDHNTFEFNAGVEYDVCKWVTLSGSWQITRYGLSDANMNDISFNLSNNMVGLGLRINAHEKVSIDLGYMHTIYQDRTVVDPNPKYMGMKKDFYNRKNDVMGIGVNINL